MRRLEVDTPAGFYQSSRLTHEVGQVREVLNQMQAGDRIHRGVVPPQPLPFEIRSLKLAPYGIFVRLTRYVHSEELQIRPQLRKMPERFPVGRTEIQQRSAA